MIDLESARCHLKVLGGENPSIKATSSHCVCCCTCTDDKGQQMPKTLVGIGIDLAVNNEMQTKT